MNRMSGEEDKKVVNLDQFRKEKFSLKIKVGEYYKHPEMGVHLHCIGVTIPMHTKNNEVHFIVEDHFGNLATFRTNDPPPDFVKSNVQEYAAAVMGEEPPEVS